MDSTGADGDSRNLTRSHGKIKQADRQRQHIPRSAVKDRMAIDVLLNDQPESPEEEGQPSVKPVKSPPHHVHGNHHYVAGNIQQQQEPLPSLATLLNAPAPGNSSADASPFGHANVYTNSFSNQQMPRYSSAEPSWPQQRILPHPYDHLNAISSDNNSNNRSHHMQQQQQILEHVVRSPSTSGNFQSTDTNHQQIVASVARYLSSGHHRNASSAPVSSSVSSSSTSVTRAPTLTNDSSARSSDVLMPGHNLRASSTPVSASSSSISAVALSLEDVDENIAFQLVIRQQPVHARVCGYGEKDRRTVDPPPIIQMLAFDKTTGQRINDRVPKILRHSHNFVLKCCLIDDKDSRDATTDPTTGTRMLIGQLVSSLHTLSDLNGEMGYFFVFPDLSVRLEGSYKLKFILSNIEWARNARPNDSVNTLGVIYSNTMTAYTAKKFPGMLDSSDLVKHFFDQGVKVTVRRKDRSNQPH